MDLSRLPSKPGSFLPFSLSFADSIAQAMLTFSVSQIMLGLASYGYAWDVRFSPPSCLSVAVAVEAEPSLFPFPGLRFRRRWRRFRCDFVHLSDGVDVVGGYGRRV